ncbi:MAG: hypothetical protein LW869_09895 [Actinobacteria bacterium]|nr:hypothetical protein [Actinomycetota bacterium]
MSETLDTDSSKPNTSSKDRLEFVIAVMLGLAAIITAWTAFQSTQLGDKVQESFSEGIRTSDQASQEYNTALATDNQSQAIFLEYAKAAVAGDEVTAAYIKDTLMTPELAAAVEWWIEQPEETGPESPFVEENPNWDDSSWVTAEELDVKAQEYFDAAKKADTDGDRFDLLQVIVTLSLFLFGVASLARQQKIQIGLAALGGVVLVYSIVMTIVLGDPAGLF